MATKSNLTPAERAPKPLSGKQRLMAIILVVLTVTVSEIFWRARGHSAVMTINDVATRLDYNLWSDYRHMVSGNGPRTLVLAGASRLQAGFSIATFRQRYPDFKVAQLAIPNGNPIATLRNLAEDDSFTGVVICSLRTSSLTRLVRDRDRNTITSYRQDSSFNTLLNANWSAALKRYFVILNNQLNLKNVAEEMFKKGRLPAVSQVTYSRERSLFFDFARFLPQQITSLRKGFVSNARGRMMFWSLSPTEWLSQAMEIEWMVEKIHARGGEVWFARLPSAGELLEMTEQAWPREKYWQLFADATSAGSLHFLDIPAMREFELPDYSHLDYRDAPRFTDLLLDEIVRRGGLKPG